MSIPEQSFSVVAPLEQPPQTNDPRAIHNVLARWQIRSQEMEESTLGVEIIRGIDIMLDTFWSYYNNMHSGINFSFLCHGAQFRPENTGEGSIVADKSPFVIAYVSLDYVNMNIKRYVDAMKCAKTHYERLGYSDIRVYTTKSMYVFAMALNGYSTETL